MHFVPLLWAKGKVRGEGLIERHRRDHLVNFGLRLQNEFV